MKVITAIYLNCRPDLRDEWLTGTEVDDVSDAQVSPRVMIRASGLLIVVLGSRASSSTSGEILLVY